MTELHFRTTVDACAGNRTQTYRKVLHQVGHAMARGWVVEWDEYPVYKEKARQNKTPRARRARSCDRDLPGQVVSHYAAWVKIHVR